MKKELKDKIRQDLDELYKQQRREAYKRKMERIKEAEFVTQNLKENGNVVVKD